MARLCALALGCAGASGFGLESAMLRLESAKEFVSAFGRQAMCEIEPVGGRVEDCVCDFEVVDAATRTYFGPILSNLTQRSFFRYFKVDLDRTCKFFPDDGQCAREACSVDVCLPTELPALYQEEERGRSEWNAANANNANNGAAVFCQQQFGELDDVIVDRSSDAAGWAEDGGEEVWIHQDDSAAGMEYLDLIKNPERFTGYEGEPAARIWRAIYDENCFRPDKRSVTPKEALVSAWRPPQSSGDGAAEHEDVCLERRVFYRLISGLQASISMHIAQSDFTWWTIVSSGPDVLRRGSALLGVAAEILHLRHTARNGEPSLWESAFPSSVLPSRKNDALFISRVGSHRDRLHNLYFAYLFVLRAVSRAHVDLAAYDYDTGNSTDDAMTRELVGFLVAGGGARQPGGGFGDSATDAASCASAAAARAAFDETRLFQTPDDARMSPLERALARESVEELRAQFVQRFRNVSLIMDCVTCERCRLWGKLQILGLGTALKILMLDGEDSGLGALQRNEVVALVNTLAQLAKSVDSLREWQKRDVRRALAKTAAAVLALASAALVACGAAACLLGMRRRARAKRAAAD
ncbi:endoplasmic reticulum Oxidoreductin 1-domain-containing protein [Pelagophyceae sp. CCMP2097]|nr:endoplasmic reticulum Oxidoreductin 1-domain-containing protein [Pelagophyceae sp. CCMP2097]